MTLQNVLLDFDILSFLGNATEYVKKIGSYVVILAGFIMIIVAIVQIAKGLASGGKGQVNWVMSIGCLLVGGALAFGGWTMVTNIANGGQQTIKQMGATGGAGVAEGNETAGDWAGGTILVNGAEYTLVGLD